MAEDDVSGCLRHRGEHVRIGEATRDVVDDARARCDGADSGLGVHGVDADDEALLGEGRDDRQHARHLLGQLHPLGARARGLATHIDDLCALPHQPERVGDGGFGVEESATVAEGVGCRIHDPHDHRAQRVLDARRAHARTPPINATSSVRAAGSASSPRAATVTVDASGCLAPRMFTHP